MNDQQPTQPLISYTVPNYTPPVNPETRSQKKLVLLAVSFIVVGILVILGSVTVAYAYNQIVIGDARTQAQLSFFIQGLPFMPKTPSYVVTKSVEAHQKVTKLYLDASVALTLPTALSSTFGSNNLDFRLAGPVDYTDPKKPALDMKLQYTRDLDVDFKLKDYVSYFRINKIPGFVGMYLSIMGLDQSIVNKFLDKWFYYDLTPLETDARKSLDAEYTPASLNDSLASTITLFNDPEIKPHIKMDSAKLGSVDVHHIVFTPTGAVLDSSWKRFNKELSSEEFSTFSNDDVVPSKLVQDVKYEVWIDTKSYYIQKFSLYFVMQPDSSSSEFSSFASQPIPISFVVSFKDFGKEVTVDVPEGALRIDEYATQVFAEEASRSGSYLNRVQTQSYDSQRKSDLLSIKTAVEMYSVDNKGKYPTSISATAQEISTTGANLCSSLVPKYIASIPVDPLLGGSSVTNCSSSYRTGYAIQKVKNEIVLTAPLSEATASDSL